MKRPQVNKKAGYAMAAALGTTGIVLALTTLASPARSAAATSAPRGNPAPVHTAVLTSRPVLAGVETSTAPPSTSAAIPPTSTLPARAPSPPSSHQVAPPITPGAISIQLAGIPPTIDAGGAPLEFTATLTNRSVVDAPSVAPLFQIVGGPCNCAQGSLQRFDQAQGTWVAAPMPEGDGVPNPLTMATGGINVPPGASVTVRYRLALTAKNPAKPLVALCYAVQLPDFSQLARTSVASRLTVG
jgi:hypothetical protein